MISFKKAKKQAKDCQEVQDTGGDKLTTEVVTDVQGKQGISDQITTTGENMVKKGHQYIQEEPISEYIKEWSWENWPGWQYMGEGEWVTMEDQVASSDHGNKLRTAGLRALQWLNNTDPDINLHNRVRREGYPNRWGARIPVESSWNVELLDSLLVEYHNRDIVEWIRYGWPSGRLPTLPQPIWTHKNHKGATDFPQHLDKYIHKEKTYNAVMGPYDKHTICRKCGYITSQHSTQKRDR